jgi:phosphatidylserine synthase 2
MQTMFTFFVGLVLLVYWRMDVQREEENVRTSLVVEREESLAAGADIRAGMFVVGLFLMMHFALQSRDGVMHRPHPVVWRCVHGAGVIYVMLLLFMLSFDAATMRYGLHNIVAPSLGNYSIPQTYAADCRLSWTNFCSQFFDIFTLAHAMGYVAKALVYRDWYLLWMHSILFEVIEISAGHLLPNLQECYWDRLFLDVFGANLIGMVIGMYLVNKLEQRSARLDWSTQVPLHHMTSRTAKARRIMVQFTPLTWDADKWKMTENPEHFLAAVTVLVFGLAIETTTFFLKHFLWIDTRNRWLSLIMLLKAALSAHAYREFYVYVQDRSVRIGHNCWLFIVLTLSEVGLSVKWSVENGFESPYPPRLVTAAWLTSMCFCVPWFCYHFWFRRTGRLDMGLGLCAVLPLLLLLGYDVVRTAVHPPAEFGGRQWL